VAKTGSFRLDFSIGQTIREILVLKAIQKFLLELPFASLASLAFVRLRAKIVRLPFAFGVC
jgi:hypothetical protein